VIHWTTGILVGLLVGIVSGVVFLLLLQAGARISREINIKSVITVATELLAIPAFWFAPKWISDKVLPLQEFRDPYVVGLAIAFAAMAAYPASKWILRVGEDLGRGQS